MTSFYRYDQNLSGFAFLCKLGVLLFKPRWDYIKYERKNEKDSGHSGKMMPSRK